MRVVKLESGGAAAEHCAVMTGLPLDAETMQTQIVAVVNEAMEGTQ